MPKLYIENGADRGKEYVIQSDGPFFAGRDGAAQVFIADEMASRRHFQIECKDSEFRLRDLGSSNGTYLNGSLVRKLEPLAPNDRIQVGTTLITYLDDKPHPLIGKVVSGYEILDRVGRGGMGTVYRANQVSLDRIVALKVLAPQLVANTNFVNLFIQEARSAGSLSHPNIVQVYDVGVHAEFYFYSMEYIPDGSVEDLLNRGGPIPLAKALRFTHDAARGLQYAEQLGIVHRDIKPGNLMIGSNRVVKIGDLGISKSIAGDGLASQQDGVSGSPHYIAPEQAKGEAIDSRVDIYSLGVSLYQMLSGQTPFRGPTPRDVILQHIRNDAPPLEERVEGLPRDVVRVVNSMMAKSKDGRPRTCAALVAELDTLIRKYPEDGKSVVDNSRRKKQFFVGALIIAGVVILGTGGLLVAKYVSEQIAAQELLVEEQLGLVQDAKSALDAGDPERALDVLQTIDETLLEPAKVDETVDLRSAAETRIADFAAERELERIGAEFEVLQTELETRLTELEAAPSANTETPRDWRAEVQSLRQIAGRFAEWSEQQEGHPTSAIAKDRAEEIRRRAGQRESFEDSAERSLEELRIRASGFSNQGDFRRARELLDAFDVETFRGSVAFETREELLSDLQTKALDAWEQVSSKLDALESRNEFRRMVREIEAFLPRAGFEAIERLVMTRRQAIEAKMAEIEAVASQSDQRLATAVVDIWKNFTAELDARAAGRQLTLDPQLVLEVSTEWRDRVLRHRELFDEWPGVLSKLRRRASGLEDFPLERVHDTEPQSVTIIRWRSNLDVAFEAAGEKLRSPWRDLTPGCRAELVRRAAVTPEAALFVGIFLEVAGRHDEALSTWKEAESELPRDRRIQAIDLAAFGRTAEQP